MQIDRVISIIQITEQYRGKDRHRHAWLFLYNTYIYVHDISYSKIKI